MTTPPTGTAALATFRRFRPYGAAHLPALGAGFTFRIGELLADLAQPWPLAVVVDSVIGHRPLRGVLGHLLAPFAGSSTSLLVAAASAALALSLLSAIFDYAGDRLMNGAGERITSAIRRDVFARAHRLPLAYHDRQSAGELASRITTDTDRIEDALVAVFSTFIPGLLTVTGLLVAMVAVNWRLGGLAMATAPISLFVFLRYTRLTKEAARVRRAREGGLSALAVETLTGIRTVQALGRHDVHDERFAEGNSGTLAAGLRSVDLLARFTPLVEIVAALGTTALMLVGGWMVLHRGLTVGELLVVVTYMRNLLKPVRSLSRLSLTISQAAASAERVASVLDAPLLQDADSTRPPAAPAVRARGVIEFRSVTFGYGRGEVLSRASLVIEQGERVAIVGANGAGKSSVLGLISRLYDPNDGEILLDGERLSQLPVSWLRDQIAVVPQETFLFSGSLQDNLAYGRRGADGAVVRDAARRALVEEFAAELPEGYATVLGDRGIGPSGGQRQRVAIARAILRDAPVVLLDEPTSGLDLAAEAEVVEALSQLIEGRTVVMVTHRPALLSLASRQVRLVDGLLVPTRPNGALTVGIPPLAAISS